MNLTLTQWKPFQDIERFFNEDFYTTNEPNKSSFFAPAVHVEESDTHLIVQAELPGMDEKDIKVEVENNILTIHGERKQEKKEEKKGYYYSEISFGSFERRIKLPDYVTSENTEADYKRGVLQIRLPKNPQKAPRQIEIKVSE